MPEALVTPELIDYHRAVAAGGAGMSTVAYSGRGSRGPHPRRVHLAAPRGRGWPAPPHRRHPRRGRSRRRPDRPRRAVANSRSNKARSLAPSKRFNPLAIRVIRSATDADIARITNDYARAGRLAADSGFDAIEIHLGHNYLLSAFLSPNLNKRTDSWGDSLDNRARFPRQAVQAVRAAVGDKLAVTAKINMNDGVPGGLKDDESLEFAQMLQADGALDALELTGGSSFANPMYLFRGDAPREEFAATLPPHARLGFKLAGAKLMPDYPFEEAYFLPKARRFLASLNMPLILLGGINRLDTVQSALDEGFAFVAMARALLRQPDLPNRWQAGTSTEGNCIHCNRCMPTIYSGTRCAVDHPEPLTVGPPVLH